MKTKEEILSKYIENVMGVKVVEDENALKAMEEYAEQFKIILKQELTQENCPHPRHRVKEITLGGRFDKCLDCGKTWG